MNLSELLTRLQDLLDKDSALAKEEVYFAVNFRNMFFYDPIVAVYKDHDNKIVLDATTDFLQEKNYKEVK